MNRRHDQPPLRGMVVPSSAFPASHGPSVAAGTASGVVRTPAQRPAPARRAPALLGQSPFLTIFALTSSQISNFKSRIPFGPSAFHLSSLTLVDIGSSATCCRIITRSARPSAHLPSRHSPLAPCPGPISNLKFEISNPLRLLPPALRLSSLTPVDIGSSAMCCRIITRSARPSAHTPSRHSPLAPYPGPISNLKFEISNPLRLLPSSFSLSQDPSPFPKDPSFKPEYPPLSRNIPP